MSGPTKIAKDNYLFREGDAPDAMYVVKSGKFAILKTKSNSEIVLAEIGPGAMVGEMAFFDAKPRSASVKATKDAEVIALPYKALHAQFANFPEWCKAIMRTVNDHLRNANQRIKELEKSNSNDTEVFPPHTITKLTSIINLVGHKYGKAEKEGLVINGFTLRRYTIQVFQEPTHKMQKMLSALEDLEIAKNEDLGEGRSRVILMKPDLLFGFSEWYTEFLFKADKDKVPLKEEELKVVKAAIQFGKKLTPNAKGLTKLNLTDIQNESMKELEYLVKVDDFNCLTEKKLMTEKTMEEGGLFSLVDIADLERIYPYWAIIYSLKKVRA